MMLGPSGKILTKLVRRRSSLFYSPFGLFDQICFQTAGGNDANVMMSSRA
jgi:hypothetical protein